jgi:hypothetical protein
MTQKSRLWIQQDAGFVTVADNTMGIPVGMPFDVRCESD